METSLPIYIETGKRRSFACALDWPGWSRSSANETAAVEALLASAPRYERIAHIAGLGLAPRTPVIVERLAGNATTDFGAPGMIPTHDTRPLDEAEGQRSAALLQACWQVFDETVLMAVGKVLRLGPRGGGRTLEKIIAHVIEGDVSYLSQVGWKMPRSELSTEMLANTRRAMTDFLTAAVHGNLPTHGPRGGAYWPPRYFVRRVLWHTIDHIWEIEDRLQPAD